MGSVVHKNCSYGLQYSSHLSADYMALLNVPVFTTRSSVGNVMLFFWIGSCTTSRTWSFLSLIRCKASCFAHCAFSIFFCIVIFLLDHLRRQRLYLLFTVWLLLFVTYRSTYKEDYFQRFFLFLHSFVNKILKVIYLYI